MSNAANAELYTIVENTCGVDRVFGFLGKRGKRLAAGEVFAVPGDLVASLGVASRRKFDALKASVANGSLVIRSRPAPVLFDYTDGVAKSLAVVNGALGLVDPTYADDASSSFAAV